MNRNKVMKEYHKNVKTIESKMVELREVIDSTRSNISKLRYNNNIDHLLIKQLDVSKSIIREISKLKSNGDQLTNKLSMTDFILPMIKNK